MKTQTEINQLAYKIIGLAIEVHKNLGPGLLESIYEECLIEELIEAGLKVNYQVKVPLTYKTKKLKSVLKLDLLVEDTVIVELKAVEDLAPIFSAQLLTYMKLTNKPKGLLINFNVENITNDGLVPLVNKHFSALPKK